MSNPAQLEQLIRPDSVDTAGYHIGKHVIPFGSPADQLLSQFQASQRAIGGSDVQLAVLADVRAGKLPADKPLATSTTAEQFLARGVADKDGNVTIGALTIKKDVYGDYKAALLAEGPKDPEMVAVMEKMANDKKPHTISRTDGADSRAPGGDVVWDPGHGGIDYYNEAKMSPARALKHEAIHASQNPEVQRVLLATPDKMYGNLEERNAEMAEARGMNPNNLMRGSHYSNVPYTTRDTTEAPQTCAYPEIAVRMGAGGTGALKGAGLDTSGSFDHSDVKDGTRTLYYKFGGQMKAISFPEVVSQVDGDPGQSNPLNNVTGNLKPNDQFNLKIGGNGDATLTNVTQSEQIKMHPDGRTEATSVDLTKAKSLTLVP